MKRNKQAGQALVLTAIALVVLMGFAGLAIDMGVLRYEKRLQQTAADAAAIAGANNIPYGGITTGGQNASAANGFTDNGGGQISNCSGAAVGTVCVEIDSPPVDGPHAGSTGCSPAPSCYVEARVAEVHTTYFMKVLGINSEMIMARAVATDTSGGPGSGCLYSLGTPSSSIEGVNINGSATLNATTCGIEDNGNFNTKGNALIVNADTFGMYGSPNQSGPGGSVTCSATPNNCPSSMPSVQPDPLGYLTPPCGPCSPQPGPDISIDGNGNWHYTSSLTCTTACVTYSNGVYTISPGTYGSISISGVAANSLVFSPGLYIFDDSGGLSIPGNAMIGCGSGCGSGTSGQTGVTMYFTNNATITTTGTPDIQLTAGTSQYPGVLFYQDPNDPSSPTIGGDNSSYFTGALYFPTQNLTFYGNNSSYSVGMVVAESFSLSGNPTVNLTGNVGMGSNGLVKNAILVE
jgi:hypothetical protein